MEERDYKGKKDNAFSQLMNGQNKSAAIDHFDGYMQCKITKFFSEAIKKKHIVPQKWISPNAKKVTLIVHASFGRKLLNHVTKHKWSISPLEETSFSTK